MALRQTIFRMRATDAVDFNRVGGDTEMAVEAPTEAEAEALGDTYDVNSVELFTHWFDLDRSLAALLDALRCEMEWGEGVVFAGGRPDPYDCERNGDARGWPGQYTHVRNGWWSFVKVFDFLNINLLSWGLYRRVARHYFGGAYAARKNGGLGPGAGDAAAGVLWNDLYTASARMHESGRYPDTVTIGTRAATEGGTPSHPVWVGPSNSFSVRPYDPGVFQFRVKDGAQQRYPPFDWRTACVHHWYDADPGDNAYHCYGMPALHRYWEVLFGPVPGLRFDPATGRGAIPSDLFQPGAVAARGGPDDPFSGDLSLAEYVLAIGPLRLIREVRNSVYINNTLLVSWLRGGSFSAALARQFEAEVEAENANRERIRRTAAVGDAVGEAIGEIPGPYTAAVAATVGVGSAIARSLALANVTPASSPVDTFGQPVVSLNGRRAAPLTFLAVDLDVQSNGTARAATLGGFFNEIRERNTREFGLPADEPHLGGLEAYMNSDDVSPRQRALLRAGGWILRPAERVIPPRGAGGSPLIVTAVPDFVLNPGVVGPGTPAGKGPRPGKAAPSGVDPNQPTVLQPDTAPPDIPPDPPPETPPDRPPMATMPPGFFRGEPGALRRAAPWAAGAALVAAAGVALAKYRPWRRAEGGSP